MSSHRGTIELGSSDKSEWRRLLDVRTLQFRDEQLELSYRTMHLFPNRQISTHYASLLSFCYVAFVNIRFVMVYLNDPSTPQGYILAHWILNGMAVANCILIYISIELVTPKFLRFVDTKAGKGVVSLMTYLANVSVLLTAVTSRTVLPQKLDTDFFLFHVCIWSGTSITFFETCFTIALLLIFDLLFVLFYTDLSHAAIPLSALFPAYIALLMGYRFTYANDEMHRAKFVTLQMSHDKTRKLREERTGLDRLLTLALPARLVPAIRQLHAHSTSPDYNVLSRRVENAVCLFLDITNWHTIVEELRAEVGSGEVEGYRVAVGSAQCDVRPHRRDHEGKLQGPGQDQDRGPQTTRGRRVVRTDGGAGDGGGDVCVRRPEGVSGARQRSLTKRLAETRAYSYSYRDT